MKERELDGEDDCSSPSWSRSSQMGALNFSPSEVSRAGVGGEGVCEGGVCRAGMCGACSLCSSDVFSRLVLQSVRC